MLKIEKMATTLRERMPNATKPIWTQRIFFPHVPKCAGTSVVSMMRQSFRDVHLHTISLPASSLAAKAADMEMTAQRKALAAYWMAMDQPSLITGHCHCPPTFVQAFAPQWAFITVLREPVDRWISEFVYNTHKTPDRSWARNELPLASFLDTRKSIAMGRMMVSYFGDPTAEEGQRVSTAVANLNQFTIVGFQTDLPEFQTRLSSILNVRLPVTKANASPNTDEAKKIRADPGAMRAIREICELDLALWDKMHASAG